MFFINFFTHLPVPVLHHWGYTIIMLGAFLEALPLIGTIVPGHALVIVGGFLARLQIVSLAGIMVASSVAAILGDLVGYELGKRYGYNFLTRYGRYFFFKPEHLIKTRELMHAHPGKAIIIGRFNLITRALAPFVAGTTRLPFSRFLLYNIIGGISWAISSVMLGYIFGASFEIAAKYFGRIVLGALITTALLVYGYRMLNKYQHIFAKYYLFIIGLNIVSLYGLAKLTEDVLAQEAITRFDRWVNHLIPAWRTPFLSSFIIFTTDFLLPLGVGILIVWTLIHFISKKEWGSILIGVSGGGGAMLAEVILKLIVRRPRPLGALVLESNFSFPSGHATAIAILSGLIIYFLLQSNASRERKIILSVISILLALLVGASRIYLGVHWLSDVLGGFSLAIFWLTLLLLVARVLESLKKNIATKITTKI